MADANKSKKPSLAFKWTVEMVHDLLDFLLEYKTEMEYNNSDFNADNVQQYEAIRSKMAEKYSVKYQNFPAKLVRNSLRRDERSTARWVLLM